MFLRLAAAGECRGLGLISLAVPAHPTFPVLLLLSGLGASLCKHARETHKLLPCSNPFPTKKHLLPGAAVGVI